MYNVYIMIQITAYLRTEEDLVKWKALVNKTEWLHNQLRTSQDAGSSLTDRGVKDVLKKVPSPRMSVEEVAEIFTSAPLSNLITADKLKYGKCKKCGTPLTSYGKCLQKGH
jgi:hypothetical protein